MRGLPHLDLDYGEDSTAEVDFNVVMTDDDRLIEVQGTAEHGAFTREQMDQMIDLAAAGIRQLFALQRAAIEATRRRVKRLLVATTNPGKQSEFRRLLRPLPAEIVTPDEIGLDLESTSRMTRTRRTPSPRPSPSPVRRGW